MYLSRVKIDVNNRRKIRDLTNLEAYHGWVEHCFPNDMAGENRIRKLWRIDYLNGEPYLMIVSPTKPDLKILEKYGVSGTAMTKDYDSALKKIETGKKYRFRAVLNPAYSIKVEGNSHGRIVPHITAAYQTKYLLDRADKNGFHINENEVMLKSRDFKPMVKNGRAVKLCVVAYEGILTVTNAEEFEKVLVSGMGREKAYGCGMFTVIPA